MEREWRGMKWECGVSVVGALGSIGMKFNANEKEWNANGEE